MLSIILASELSQLHFCTRWAQIHFLCIKNEILWLAIGQQTDLFGYVDFVLEIHFVHKLKYEFILRARNLVKNTCTNQMFCALRSEECV